MTDEIETLNKRLKEIVEHFNNLKNCGMDEEILMSYLQMKTKLSKKRITELLYHIDEFYEKLIKKAVINGLKE